MFANNVENEIIVLLGKMNEQQRQEILNFARRLTNPHLSLIPLQSELEAKELQESAELYAEIYREDKELQVLTESALEGWPQD